MTVAEFGPAPWTALALGCVGLRVIGAVLVAAGIAPAWTALVVEAAVWVGVPAVLDPAVLTNVMFWIGLALMFVLWVPGVALNLRRSRFAADALVPVVVLGVLALAIQVAVTEGVVAAAISEATDGRVCQGPRKIISRGGDLYPLPPGSVVIECVQGASGRRLHRRLTPRPITDRRAARSASPLRGPGSR